MQWSFWLHNFFMDVQKMVWKWICMDVLLNSTVNFYVYLHWKGLEDQGSLFSIDGLVRRELWGVMKHPNMVSGRTAHEYNSLVLMESAIQLHSIEHISKQYLKLTNSNSNQTILSRLNCVNPGLWTEIAISDFCWNCDRELVSGCSYHRQGRIQGCVGRRCLLSTA